MGIATTIEYVDSSCNPIKGCDGCELYRPRHRPNPVFICYAGNIVDARGGRFTDVRFMEHRIPTALAWKDLTGQPRPANGKIPAKPWLDGLPRVVFWCDMSDAFTKSAPPWIWDHYPAMRRAPHVHLLLTKRPSAMVKQLAGLELNERWWLGTSVTSQAVARRVHYLLEARDEHPDAKLWVSVEPAWGPVDLRPWLPELDWIVWGGQSGTGAIAASWDWARDLRDQCAIHGVPFFLKQGGSRLATKTAKGGRLDELPADLRIREMPMQGTVPQQGGLFDA